MAGEFRSDDTIAAISTPLGEGGIGIVRLSGADAISLVDKAFVSPKGQTLAFARSWSLNYGWIVDKHGEKIDEVIVRSCGHPTAIPGKIGDQLLEG